ncbi:hypothetical protein ACJW30_12G145200 [Castanea mollissima]
MLGLLSLSTLHNNAIKLVSSQSFVSTSATATKPTCFARNLRVKMSSDTLPPPPEKGIVVGCGGASVDFLAAVATYPTPDDKIRTTNLKVQGGGNAGNALTCAARLGLKPRLISKVANDTQGRDILDEFKADGVDTSFIVAVQKSIPILIDAERKREGLDDLLKLADYVICSEKFPKAWTEAPSLPSALVSILLRLPNINFVIVTLGEDGCIMLERSVSESSGTQEIDVDVLLESLKQQQKDESKTSPTYISSSKTRLRAKGIGTLCGRLFLGTAEKIPPSELIDTTGAGDAFIGAVIYAICADMPPEQMLPFAARVAAANCRALGARAGLPYRTDPRLASFLKQSSQVITSLAK